MLRYSDESINTRLLEQKNYLHQSIETLIAKNEKGVIHGNLELVFDQLKAISNGLTQLNLLTSDQPRPKITIIKSLK
jgi:hypothetical protein